MNKRKYKSRRNSSNPEAIIVLMIFGGIALYTLGVPEQAIVELIIVATFIVVILYLVIRVLFGSWSNGRFLLNFWRTRNIKNVDKMSGLQFERYVAKILKSRGCTDIRLTEHYDLGVDIIAKKDGITWGIQAKRYSILVKADAVRQAVTALKEYGCDRSMVITNSPDGYSRPAKELAKSNGCILIERSTLSKWVNEHESRNKSLLEPKLAKNDNDILGT